MIINRVVCVAVLYLCVASVALAQTPSNLVDPTGVLKGLRGLDVLVKVTSVELDSTAVRTLVSDRLKENGFNVGSKNSPFLTVYCSALDKADRAIAAFTCDLSLHQFATVIPNNVLMMATTWSTSSGVAMLAQNQAKESMLTAIDGMLEEFLAAWRRVNTKKK